MTSLLRARTSVSRALMAAMAGCSFLMSRSCLVPINQAMKLSRIFAASINGPAGGRFAGLLTGLSGSADLRSALLEVRPRRPLSYLKCKQSILTGWAQKRQERAVKPPRLLRSRRRAPLTLLPRNDKDTHLVFYAPVIAAFSILFVALIQETDHVSTPRHCVCFYRPHARSKSVHHGGHAGSR